jgi:hypothetical protein
MTRKDRQRLLVLAAVFIFLGVLLCGTLHFMVLYVP